MKVISCVKCSVLEVVNEVDKCLKFQHMFRDVVA